MNFEFGPDEWDDFCSKCTDDPHYDEEVDQAANILEGEALPHFDTADVVGNDEFEVTVTRPFIGIPRSDFRALTGMDPSECSVTESDLKNELGQVFKGVLLQNPSRPWLEYSLTHKLGVRQSTNFLKNVTHCRQGADENVMDKQREIHNSTPFVTRLRNCTVTVQDLEKKVGRPFLSNLGPAFSQLQPVNTDGVGGSPSGTEVPSGSGPKGGGDGQQRLRPKVTPFTPKQASKGRGRSRSPPRGGVAAADLRSACGSVKYAAPSCVAQSVTPRERSASASGQGQHPGSSPGAGPEAVLGTD